MALSKSASQLRSLALIRASGSTARILNLSRVHQRFGNEPDYAAQPMFRNPAINRALIIKHVVRPGERDSFDNPPTSVTKILLPFSAEDLTLGGHSLMLGERNFERSLREFYGGAEKDAFDVDLELLRLLDTLPSFDPFLMRERLKASGYEPARCYFDLSEADVSRMRAFVAGEIEPLIGLAFANGGAAARDLSRKLAEKLMSDETAKPLDPLRQTLRLSPEEYREGVFTWKGFLYYKWSVGDFLPKLPAFRKEVLAARFNGVDPDSRTQLNEMRAKIVTMLEEGANRVGETLLDYGMAYAALTEGRAGEFRNFLLRAPALFVPMGEAVGVIRHVESFWRFRFPEGRIAMLNADEAFEIMVDFHATLAGMACLNQKPQADAA